jgi:hypothetical protein
LCSVIAISLFHLLLIVTSLGSGNTPHCLVGQFALPVSSLLLYPATLLILDVPLLDYRCFADRLGVAG